MTIRLAGTVLLCIALLTFCGLSAFAAEDPSQDVQEPTPAPAVTVQLPPAVPEDERAELYPADVKTIIDVNGRQIVRTYILTAEQRPADIPRDSFVRDGWRYTLTDIIEQRTASLDTWSHIETVEINTDSNDLNEIIQYLSPTLEYESEGGYVGVLTLNLNTVTCEESGRRNSSFTATATRVYPHLSNPDTSLIPKTITENNRTLTLDSVSWETQNYTNVDYMNIPDSYRAIASYSVNASRSVVTGYITTAEYIGDISKLVTGDTVYTAFFTGVDMTPAPSPIPIPAPEPEPEPEPEPPLKAESRFPIIPVAVGLAILAALAGAAAYWFLFRHNVKVYKVIDEHRVLAAKDRISAKHLTINLTPLEGKCFELEIDKLTAKTLNGKTLEVVYSATYLKHRIAFEGNIYRIDADFANGTINAIY